MDNILVTVIITTYDRPENLRLALSSVVNQTYKNLEIIIIDGKGLKKTEEIVKACQVQDGGEWPDGRIIYLKYNKEKTTIQ